MKTCRSILIIFSFFVFGIGAVFLNFLVFPFLKTFLKETDFRNISSKIIQKTWLFFLNFLIFLRLIKIKTDDKDKLKNIKNKIIVSTHPSFIDIVILIALIPKSTCYTKNSLTKNFIIKNLVNSIFISNDLELEKMEEKSKKLLKEGFNIIIFPMGTRHRKNEHPKIKKGASLIAAKTNTDIVPIKLTSDGDFLFINQPFWDGSDKTVTFDIALQDEIKVQELFNESEIIYKKNVTKEIEKRLYN